MNKTTLENLFPVDLLPQKKGDYKPFNNREKVLWDDTNGIISSQLEIHNKKLIGQYEYLKENPDHPKIQIKDAKKKMMPFIIAGIAFMVIARTVEFFSVIGITLIGFGVMTMGGVSGYYRKITYDLIKYHIAQKKSWTYFPEKSKKGWSVLNKKYPEIFSKGNDNRYIEDIFQGSINYDHKKYNFNSGLFYHTTSDKDSKGVPEINNYITIKLDKQIKVRFELISGILKELKEKKIRTESIEFNKSFSFSYLGRKEDMELEIQKILTPVVIENLAKMSKLKSDLEVLFTKHSITFMYKGRFLPNLLTDLTKGNGFDNRDEENLEKNLDMYLDIVKEIYKTLD